MEPFPGFPNDNCNSWTTERRSTAGTRSRGGPRASERGEWANLPLANHLCQEIMTDDGPRRARSDAHTENVGQDEVAWELPVNQGISHRQ